MTNPGAFRRARTLVRHFVADDAGQDLIEYGLLALMIGLAGVGLFPIIRTKMQANYQGWGMNINNIWIPPPPGP
jgi:Flp pilus assembly pilin Flp